MRRAARILAFLDRMVLALARCAVRGEPISATLLSTRDSFYYPETLRFL